MKYSQRPLIGQKWQVDLFKLTFVQCTYFTRASLSIHSYFDDCIAKMPRKNKVHVSVIEVQEFNENEINQESPTPLDEVITEIPPTTGQKYNCSLTSLAFTFE